MAEETDEHPIIDNQVRIMKAEVIAAAKRTPHLVEVTLRGDDFRAMPDLGPDAFCYIFAPRPGEERPAVDYDFSWDTWRTQDPDVRPQGRYYTVRRFRPSIGEVDFQMLLHGAGPLSTWAETAAPGQHVALWGPRASFRLPSNDAPLLLAADHSGLPALSRILESLPSDARGRAFVELDSQEDRQDTDGPPGVSVEWLVRGSTDRGALLMDAVSACDIAPGAYAWVAAETGVVGRIRAHLRGAKGMAPKAVCAIGYWQAE